MVKYGKIYQNIGSHFGGSHFDHIHVGSYINEYELHKNSQTESNTPNGYKLHINSQIENEVLKLDFPHRLWKAKF